MQVREHELDEEKAEADANNSNALTGELAERKRVLEQWSVAAYGEVLTPPKPPCCALQPHLHYLGTEGWLWSDATSGENHPSSVYAGGCSRTAPRTLAKSALGSVVRSIAHRVCCNVKKLACNTSQL